MKIKLAYTLALFALPVLANTPPEITNVRASQRTDTKLVDIYYDAADVDGDLLKVRIEISDNDGVRYSVPAFSLTGDIGEGIAAGKDKHIVWDAGTDWDGEYSDKMRVKVYAIDAQGFPGLEWGNEVPPGGFLMGQDGGAEGSGPSRHVNIPWSYWLSKYEITAGQYCDFLNATYAAGNVYLDGTTYVRSRGTSAFAGFCNYGVCLCKIGDDQSIRWNVNKFECLSDTTNYPAIVSYYGAIAFARFYGYDLPTEAEWEKAARGPDNDDQDEHLLYPWGNTWTKAYAHQYGGYKPVGYYDGNQTPVGPDTINGYGLYDVIGNAAEWTRSAFLDTVSEYPLQDTLIGDVNNPYRYGHDYNEKRAYRGAYKQWYDEPPYAIYWRSYAGLSGNNDANCFMGFRVSRRIADDICINASWIDDFNWPSLLDVSPRSGAKIWYSNRNAFVLVGTGDQKALKVSTGNNEVNYLRIDPQVRMRIAAFSVRVKNESNESRNVYLKRYSYYNSTTQDYTSRDTPTCALEPNMNDFRTIWFDGCPCGMDFYLYMQDGIVVDEIKIYTPTE